MLTRDVYDLAVVGAGIVGLAHALAAARLGKRVVVFERDLEAVGASIRNFGFVTVTGQPGGETWRRARRSRDVWREIAALAGITIEHEGLTVVARRPEARAVLEAFLDTSMAEGCMLLTPQEAIRHVPSLAAESISAALYSPHEMRVESRTALPRLARLLAERFGVTFHYGKAVQAVSPPKITTSRGQVEASRVVVCPGDDFVTLFPEIAAQHRLTRCQLQMMRLVPADAGFTLGTAVMSDLGLVRYGGYAALPEAAALRDRLQQEQPEHLQHGIHLIMVQSTDGSLVVGDSHLYAETPPPFSSERIDTLILEEATAVLNLPDYHIDERWTGTYASSPDAMAVIDEPAQDVKLVYITSGTGASTAFAIAEEVVTSLFDTPIPALEKVL
ncbi:MAG: TIGR03364 family FAD-dependent oxidoreductase [Pseudomonadota bacterium]